MTLFKTPGSVAIPSPSLLPTLEFLNKRERQCLQDLLTYMNTPTLLSHPPNQKLWDDVFQYITVTGSNYDFTVAMPTPKPLLGIVSEAATLFAMYCIRKKIKEYTEHEDPADATQNDDDDEMDTTKRPKIVNRLLAVLKSNGYVYDSLKSEQYYELIDPDLITIQGAGSRFSKMKIYSPPNSVNLTKEKAVLENFKTILDREITRIARCFYREYFSDLSLFMSHARLVASGNGTDTKGLLNEPNKGLIFFGYEYKNAPRDILVKEKTTIRIASAGIGRETTLHFAIDGLNYPTTGIDPGYATADAQKFNTTVVLNINGIDVKFRANRGLTILTPVDAIGGAVVSPTPAAGISNYTFKDRSGVKIATYSTATGDLNFTDTTFDDIILTMTSGEQEIPLTSGGAIIDLDEVMLYLTNISAGLVGSNGLLGLFHPDKFELSLGQKLDLKTNFLDETLTGTSTTIGQNVIKSIQNYSSAKAIERNKKIIVSGLTSQGFIGKVIRKKGQDLIVDTNPKYHLTLDRSGRTLEKKEVIDNEAKYRRASMVGVTLNGNTLNFDIISFEDESWSRLDRKVVGVTGEIGDDGITVTPVITEPRAADITDQERLNKLTTLDNKTEYKKKGRPATSTETTGLKAAYTDVGAVTHPNPFITNGTNIANPSTQVSGFIPTYNPVLGGLRSLGVLEGIRDNLAKDSLYDYYVFSVLHELLFKTTVPVSERASSTTVSELGLAGPISYFDYQSLKWYSSHLAIYDLPNYHTGGNVFKILVPPGSGQSSPDNGAYPKVEKNTSVDVYLCVAKDNSSDKFVNSAYYNNATSQEITVSVSDPANDSVIEFYTDMNNTSKIANGTTGKVEFKLYSIPNSSGIPAPYAMTGFHSVPKIIGVGGVARFCVKKATPGTVTITVSQIGSGAIATKTQTLTFE